MVRCGVLASPRFLDFVQFRAIADEVGALLMANTTHASGLPTVSRDIVYGRARGLVQTSLMPAVASISAFGKAFAFFGVTIWAAVVLGEAA